MDRKLPEQLDKLIQLALGRGAMRRRAAGLAAAVLALIAMDVFLLTVAFLYEPDGAWATFAVVAVVSAAALATRRAWLVFAAQNVVTAALLYRLVQYAALPAEMHGSGHPLVSLIVPVGSVAIGNLLAWPLARWVGARGRA